MKKFKVESRKLKPAALLLCCSLFTVPCSLLFAQQPAGTNEGTFDAAFAAPALTGVGSATLTYTAGTVYSDSGSQSIVAGTLTTLGASKGTCTVASIQAGTDACYYVYWHAGTSLSGSNTYATASAQGNVILGELTTDASSKILTIIPASLFLAGGSVIVNASQVAGTLAAANIPAATASATGGLKLAGDLSGTSASPTVVASHFTSAVSPNAAAGVAVGTAALPFSSLVIGTAATNNLTITPAVFAQGTTATVSDPALAAVTAPLVKRGTITWTTGAILAGACTTAQTATVTGLATTTLIAGASHPTAADANYEKGLVAYWYPTANTVNLLVCNPTAGSLTASNATDTFAFVAFVP